MVSRKPFYLLVALLYIVGLGMTIYHHIALDVPLTPGEKRQIWSIEAKLEFEATGEPVIASLAIPGTQPGFTLMNENAASPGYGLSFVEKDGDARAEWSIRTASGRQELYYRVDMMADAHAKPAANPQPPAIEKQIESEPYATAMKQILERAQERSADGYTLTREIIKEIEKQEQNAELLKKHKSRANLIAELLNNADVPARVVHALSLEDGRRRQELVDYLQVFNSPTDYKLFNPQTGEQGRPGNLLLWEYNSGSLLDVTGGHNSKVSFSMIEQEQPVSVALAQKFEKSEMMNFSIHSLPLEEQTLFKGLLLIPIGVLMVVVPAGHRRDQDLRYLYAGADRGRIYPDPADHRSGGLPAYRRYRSGDPLLSIAAQPAAGRTDIGHHHHGYLVDRGLLGVRLQAGADRRHEDHLLPDDHPLLDYRTDVHPVGRRGSERGIPPGWRLPAGGSHRLSGHG